jgi:hypothetical protein
MSLQFFLFFTNGIILGFVSLLLQGAIYNAIGNNSSLAYGVATFLTYLPLVFINFIIQREWIFKKHGTFWRFLISNLSIMAMVSLLAPICRMLITDLVSAEWGDKCGFALAALCMSVPSYYAKRFFVFTSGSEG